MKDYKIFAVTDTDGKILKFLGHFEPVIKKLNELYLMEKPFSYSYLKGFKFPFTDKGFRFEKTKLSNFIIKL